MRYARIVGWLARCLGHIARAAVRGAGDCAVDVAPGYANEVVDAEGYEGEDDEEDDDDDGDDVVLLHFGGLGGWCGMEWSQDGAELSSSGAELGELMAVRLLE
ncbi:hypothetical protein B0T16DRAFT_419010 [Cercophora newfieldiana]|uniref:Secreted protein n=1 Tax=Cercophora newfieldiana TaxID=92897 RepID=A0AA40CJC9_9PEZI|nr:hypothetical protein B0T16DRAFT_419010 [Cercophora newfieldiana]